MSVALRQRVALSALIGPSVEVGLRLSVLRAVVVEEAEDVLWRHGQNDGVVWSILAAPIELSKQMMPVKRCHTL